MRHMNVVEIFNSIEGEGTRQGTLCTFLRLFDCNIRCSYCDTLYSYDDNPYKKMNVREVANRIREIGNRCVTITGGEPLLQYDEVIGLIEMLPEYEFNIETNGTIEPKYFAENVFYTVDYKCPSSNAEEHMNPLAFYNLQKNDVIKFVVGTYADLTRMAEVLQSLNTVAHIYVSPVWGKIDAAEIVDFIKSRNMQGVRMQLQIHKFIWAPDERGV